MEQETAPAPKKRLTVFGKRARQKRIFARLREGWAYDEIAREERLTAARVRQIVSEVLQKRQVDDSMAHALLQLSRLSPALQLAGEVGGQGRAPGDLAPARGARPARPLPRGRRRARRLRRGGAREALRQDEPHRRARGEEGGKTRGAGAGRASLGRRRNGEWGGGRRGGGRAGRPARVECKPLKRRNSRTDLASPGVPSASPGVAFASGGARLFSSGDRRPSHCGIPSRASWRRAGPSSPQSREGAASRLDGLRSSLGDSPAQSSARISQLQSDIFSLSGRPSMDMGAILGRMR